MNNNIINLLKTTIFLSKFQMDFSFNSMNSLQYMIKVDMKRGMLSKDLTKQTEFIIEYKVRFAREK